MNKAAVIPAANIAKRLTELAGQIDRDYAGLELDIVYLMNGSSMFCADLIRKLKTPTRIYPMGFDSYDKANASGEVRVTLDIKAPLYGKHVLVLEGIVVSGRTPRYILDMLKLRQPSTIKMCVLGVKTHMLKESLPLQYVGFELGEEFLSGYGIGAPEEKALADLCE